MPSDPFDVFGPAYAETSAPKPSGSVVRATHATVRAQRLVRKAAVARFGRGKTQLDYRFGYWFVTVYNVDGDVAAQFVAIDRAPGVARTGVEFVPAP